jgi:hypothetical protein
MCLRCLDMKHDWTDGTKKRWRVLFVYAIVLLFLPGSLNILFRNLYFMNLILMTNYTLSTEFVLAQVRGNNHWRTGQVRLKILNYRTLCRMALLVLTLYRYTVHGYTVYYKIYRYQWLSRVLATVTNSALNAVFPIVP